MLQPELLEAAQRARAGLIDAQLSVDRARAEYEHAVRRLHVTGGALREIADALGISHQRVHQIVDAGPVKRRWRRVAGDPRACSFCGLQQPPAHRLIAGPGVYICDRCIALAAKVVANGAADNERVRIEPLPEGSGSSRSTAPGKPAAKRSGKVTVGCSFCGKVPGEAAAVVGTPAARICSECLELCREIIAETPRR